MAGKDQMFSQMLTVALGWLENADPEQIAQNAGICYDAAAAEFRFPFLGRELAVSYPSYATTPRLNGWYHLLILHYLHLADGHPLAGEEMSFGQMKDGLVRGGGIDRKFEQAIGRMRDLSDEKLARICGEMGGQRIATNADAAYRIPFLPRFPMTVKVWFADEEFPASGRLLIDKSADHYLTIEDAVMAAELLLETIVA